METILFGAYSCAMIVAIICVMMVVMQKSSREQKTILLITIFTFISTVGYWSSLHASNLEARLLSQKLIYIGASHLFYMMLVFFLSYCHIRIPRWFYWGGMTFNNIIMISVLFCEYHPYFYRSVSYINSGGLPNLEKEYGIFHHLYLAGMAVYGIGMFVVSVRHLVQRRGKQRNLGNVGLFLAILVPSILYCCEKGLELDFYVVPFGLLLGEIILIILIYELKIYDVNATATEYIFGTIQDVIIMVDKRMRYKGCNQKALEVYPWLKSAVTDMDIREFDSSLEDIILEKDKNDVVIQERIYEPLIKPINVRGAVAGYVLWLYDVTEERLHTRLLENYQKDLEREVHNKTIQLQGMQEHMVTSFANIMESRDGVTGGHAKRTSAYVNAIIEELLKRGLFQEEIDEFYAARMRLAAPLHDIGKIAIPDTVLTKAGIYTKDEYLVMKKHSAIGAEIVEKNFSQLEDQDFYYLIRDIAHYHHEKWNGEGYPSGLKQEEIPLCARIMAIADVFDALVSRRPYKESFTIDKSYDIIVEESDKSFDPRLVECFVAIRPAIEEIMENFRSEMQEELHGVDNVMCEQ